MVEDEVSSQPDLQTEPQPLEIEELDAESLEEVSGGATGVAPTDPVKEPGNGCINGSC